MNLVKQDPTLIIYNASVHSVNNEDEIFEAIALYNNIIVALGDNDDILKLSNKSTKLIDAEGKSVIPGIIDGHNHAWEAGLMYDGVVLFGINSIEELQHKLKEKISKTNKGVWIQGGSYVESQFVENRSPNKEDLDKVSKDNPIVIERIFGACVANSLALKKAGITKDTPNPKSGEIEKDEITGEPTGVLKGNAVLLIRDVMTGPFGSDEFGANKGEPSIDLLEKSILLALEHYKTYGITSITEPGVSTSICRAYHNLLKNGELSCRIDLMPNWHGFTLMQDEESLNKIFDTYNFTSGYGNQWISYSALKMAVDGGLTSGTALKSWPYKGESELRKFNLRLDLEKLPKYVKKAHDMGWDVGIHVMGDIAIKHAVDAIYDAVKSNPRSHRHQIIHAYYPSNDSIKKMSEVGMIASVQGSFIYGEADGYDEILPIDKQNSFLPLRTYIDNNIICNLSTDMPCADVNPFWNMYAAVTRKGIRGYRLGTIEKITIQEALRMMTINGAIQNREEEYKGSLEVGKLADIAVLNKNLNEIDEDEIKDIYVEKTILDGKIIYDR